MYNSEKDVVNNEQELIGFLSDKYQNYKGNQVIMGGHYLLLYDKEKKSLFPSIKEETNNIFLKKYIDDIIKDFPFKSFNISVELTKLFRNLKTALLVNDQSFRSKAITEHDKNVINGDGFLLRKNYFHSPKNIPKVYAKLLQNNNIKEKDFFLTNFEPNADENTKLPLESFFFSESVLHRNFRKQTMGKLISEKTLYCTINNNEKEVRYQSTYKKNTGDYCVSSSRTSPCMVIALQLFYELFIKYKTDHVFMLVPNDCEASVNKAAEIILDYTKNLKHEIVVISNLEFSIDAITLNRHYYDS